MVRQKKAPHEGKKLIREARERKGDQKVAPTRL